MCAAIKSNGQFENRPRAAAISMLGAMVILGFIDNFIARISETVGVWQFVILRSLFMAPLLMLMSYVGLGSLRPKNWAPVLARALILSTSMFLYFGALGLMQISEALAGLFTSPIWVLLINAIVQRRRIGPWRVFAVLVGFCGTLLVLQLGGRGINFVMMMPVAAGFFYAVSSIATRSWCAGESALGLLGANILVLGCMAASVQVLLYFLSLDTGGYLARSWVWPISDVVPYIVLQAVGSLAGVFCIIRAYQMDEPSNVAVFEYSVMIFASTAAWLFFGQLLSFWQVLGIGLIILAGLIIAFRAKWSEISPQNSR